MSILRLRQVARAKGMNMSQLARLVGIHPVAMGNIARETHMPNVSTLKKIADKLEVPISSLFSDYLDGHEVIGQCPFCGALVDVRTNMPPRHDHENA